MIRFETLLEKVRSYSPEADLELLRRAYVFSALEHKGQVRHSGEPYLVHPLEVADFLADMKLDVVAVAAGLLHDVVEDTLTTPERIAELFGPEIAHVVEGVTKIGAIPFSSSEERQAENFRKMLLAMVDDIRVILVKLADRLHNMRTLHHLPEERRIKIAQETLDIYAPIANRLGMSKVKNELEELSFRYLEPKAYEGAARQGRGQAEERRGRHRGADADDPRQARRRAGPGHQPRRPDQAPLQHPPQAETPEDRSRARLRLRRAARDHAIGQGLLRRARHHPPDVVAGARTHQGLHRDAAAERLPVAAHVGHQRARVPVRGADPDRGNAPPRRGRHRRALEVQGRARRRPPRRALLPVDAPAARSAAGSARPAGVHAEPEDRPLPGGGLHLHAEGRGAVAAARRDRRRLRVQHPHRRRQPVRRRPHQRQDGAAAHPPAERRHRRDHHAGRAQAEPRLADVRRHVARAQQDQARAAGRGARAQHRARPAAVRQGGAALRSESEDDARERGAGEVRVGIRRAEARRAARAHRLRQAVGAHGAAEGGARRPAQGEGAGIRRGLGRQARAAARRRARTRSRCAAPTT